MMKTRHILTVAVATALLSTVFAAGLRAETAEITFGTGSDVSIFNGVNSPYVFSGSSVLNLPSGCTITNVTVGVTFTKFSSSLTTTLAPFNEVGFALQRAGSNPFDLVLAAGSDTAGTFGESATAGTYTVFFRDNGFTLGSTDPIDNRTYDPVGNAETSSLKNYIGSGTYSFMATNLANVPVWDPFNGNGSGELRFNNAILRVEYTAPAAGGPAATPEPGTLVSLGTMLGMTGFGIIRKRRVSRD